MTPESRAASDANGGRKVSPSRNEPTRRKACTDVTAEELGQLGLFRVFDHWKGLLKEIYFGYLHGLEFFDTKYSAASQHLLSSCRPLSAFQYLIGCKCIVWYRPDLIDSTVDISIEDYLACPYLHDNKG